MAIARAQMGKQLTGNRKKAAPRKPVAQMAKGGKAKAKSGVNAAGNYTKPSLRKRIVAEVKASGKGGKPGQWSARKAQMVAKKYKAAGGGYRD